MRNGSIVLVGISAAILAGCIKSDIDAAPAIDATPAMVAPHPNGQRPNPISEFSLRQSGVRDVYILTDNVHKCETIILQPSSPGNGSVAVAMIQRSGVGGKKCGQPE